MRSPVGLLLVAAFLAASCSGSNPADDADVTASPPGVGSRDAGS